MRKINRREFMSSTAKAGVALAFLPYLHSSKQSTSNKNLDSEKSQLIGQIISGVQRKKEQEAYLRAYLQNSDNISVGRTGQKYITARIKEGGEIELESFYTPGGMWCQFKWFGELGQPRAIKYLRN